MKPARSTETDGIQPATASLQPGSDASTATSDAPERGVIYGTFAGAAQMVRTFRAHPVWGVVLTLLLFVLAYAGNKALDWVQQTVFGPDEFLVQMVEDQKKQFAELKENLDKLGRSIASGDKVAFQAVESAVNSVETTNQNLVQQLALAKEENDSLRRALEQDSGIAGGYEFILSEGQGVRIDRTTAIGFNSFNGGAAGLIRVSLTTKDDSKEHYLSPGGSIGYTSADGLSCRIALLTVRGAGISHAASLSRLCNSKTDPAVARP